MVKIRELSELCPIVYSDQLSKIKLNCYADTLVFNKIDSKNRDLVAMRFGGYPEHVRAMADALNHNVGIETVIENHSLILKAPAKKYKRSITHDGIYAEGTMVALDDESSDADSDSESKSRKSSVKRKMYI